VRERPSAEDVLARYWALPDDVRAMVVSPSVAALAPSVTAERTRPVGDV
jgi:hypothetical protein